MAADPFKNDHRAEQRVVNTRRRHPRAIVAVKAVHTAVFLVELASIGCLVAVRAPSSRRRKAPWAGPEDHCRLTPGWFAGR
jgi:hypothetical protein